MYLLFYFYSLPHHRPSAAMSGLEGRPVSRLLFDLRLIGKSYGPPRDDVRRRFRGRIHTNAERAQQQLHIKP